MPRVRIVRLHVLLPELSFQLLINSHSMRTACLYLNHDVSPRTFLTKLRMDHGHLLAVDYLDDTADTKSSTELEVGYTAQRRAVPEFLEITASSNVEACTSDAVFCSLAATPHGVQTSHNDLRRMLGICNPTAQTLYRGRYSSTWISTKNVTFDADPYSMHD